MLIDKITAEQTLSLRHKVLWPDKPEEFCRLDDDTDGIHYGGFINGKLISTASIFIDKNRARLRKFATLPEYQHKGYGTIILNKIIKDLIDNNLNYFWCDARVEAEGFYNRFNMKKTGDVFLKSSVEYIVMERDLMSVL